MNFTKRQKAIYDNIPECDSLADVGCDHGYIGIGALHNDIANRLYLCDISAPSLHKATSLACSMNLDNVTSHCQDGIGDIHCSCAVVAGMGGIEIISILDNATHKPQYLVLQPMRNAYEVRIYLLSHGYDITRDYIVHDDKYYVIIVAQLAQASSYSHIQLTLGKSNLLQPTEDFASYLQLEIDKCNTILQHTYVPAKAERRALLLEAQQYIGGKL